MVFAGPRVYFAMARDNAFFKSAATVHPTYRTPAVSILAQAGLAILLVMLTHFTVVQGGPVIDRLVGMARSARRTLRSGGVSDSMLERR